MPGLFGSKESGFSGGATPRSAPHASPQEAAPDPRQSALEATAFRWIRPVQSRPCIDAPLYEGPVEGHGGSLQAALDAFMDRHLPWLPVPRYSDASRPTADVTDEDVVSSMIEMTELFTTMDATEALRDLQSLYDFEAAALGMLPLIDILRAVDTPVETAAALCILTALDAKTATAISEAAVLQPDFAPKAQKLISRELGRQFSTLHEAIRGAHAYLQKKAIQLAESSLPKGEASWQLLADAEAKYYMPHKAAIETAIAEHSEQTGLSVDYLRSRCRIQNLVAEDLVIGF